MRRALTLTAILLAVGLLAGCSAVQVQLWFKVYQHEDISLGKATEIARNLNRQIRPGCDENYSGRCVPNNQVDVDCVGAGDGPAFVTGPFRVVGWDHYGLDPDNDKIACEPPPPPPPTTTTTTTTTTSTTTSTTTTTTSTTTTTVPPPADPYDIVLRPVAPLTAPQQAAFDAAVATWEAAISAGVPSVPIDIPAGDCLAGSEPLSETVDDLVIDVAVRPIDGEGGTLGQANPCYVGTSDGLTRVGVMEFDSADVESLLTAGTFDDLVRHEMAHVIGLGSLWADFGLVSGSGTSDPRYTGTAGVAAYHALGGTQASIPLEATGGVATAEAHWRESAFGNELMTGFLNTGANPLSSMSIASLADLGYQVDTDAADPYSIPGAGVAALRLGPVLDLGTMRQAPHRRLPG